MLFLLDENVHVGLIKWLKELGHDAKRAPLGIENGEVAKLAHAESRVLLTHDFDFTDPETFSPDKHAGIIWINMRVRKLDKMQAALTLVFSQIPAEKVSKKIVLLEEDKFPKIS